MTILIIERLMNRAKSKHNCENNKYGHTNFDDSKSIKKPAAQF